jgi:hypothetical protein
MKYLICALAGFILGSVGVFAQSSFDFGAVPDQRLRSEIQQWWVEKEIRNGNNPYTQKPCQ